MARINCWSNGGERVRQIYDICVFDVLTFNFNLLIMNHIYTYAIIVITRVQKFLVGKKVGKRVLHRLTDLRVKSETKPGRHADGGGLYLSISATGAKSWIFMFQDRQAGKRREMGLGPYAGVRRVSLKIAREKAERCRQFLAEGKDPIVERDREDGREKTFAEVTELFLSARQSEWRNLKHIAQWEMTLGNTYCSSIRSKPISTISRDDIVGVLKPMWQTKTETATRLRGRLERVFEFAEAKGWRSGANPALWRGGLRGILPKPEKLKNVKHHAAMPYSELPDFIAQLRRTDAIAARALEFLILTAGRSGEVLGSTWDEIDQDSAIWLVPAERMKMRREHRVPISSRALEILNEMRQRQMSCFVFPGNKKNRPLSNMAFSMLMRRLGVGSFTAHGFRSSFRDWAGDETEHPREVAEAALAHVIGNRAEQSYRRRDALEKRRALMTEWGAFLSATKVANNG